MVGCIDNHGAGCFRSVIGNLLAQETRVDRLVRALWFQHLIVRGRVGIGHSPILLVARIVLLWRGAQPLARPPLWPAGGGAQKKIYETRPRVVRGVGVSWGQCARACVPLPCAGGRD